MTSSWFPGVKWCLSEGRSGWSLRSQVMRGGGLPRALHCSATVSPTTTLRSSRSWARCGVSAEHRSQIHHGPEVSGLLYCYPPASESRVPVLALLVLGIDCSRDPFTHRGIPVIQPEPLSLQAEPQKAYLIVTASFSDDIYTSEVISAMLINPDIS